MPPAAISLETWQFDLLSWFDRSRRDLPWRRTKDPYSIWVSEVMLQQTQVATVIPYFERWMSRFPSVEALSRAPEDEVLAHWAGLGYYRRARMLHSGAKVVAGAGMPCSAAEWEKVPGVGRYTAGAIASIALGKKAALVDGNVERVYARLSADSRSGRTLTKAAWSWADDHVPGERPGDWNEALMELGATICTPRAPKCDDCPIAMVCRAYADGDQNDLPVRLPKREVIQLHQFVMVTLSESRVGLRQIPTGEWWEGMWQFPRFEALNDGRGEPLMTFRHPVTHHRITLDVYFHRGPMEGLAWFSLAEAEGLALPSPDRKILERVLIEFGSCT